MTREAGMRCTCTVCPGITCTTDTLPEISEFVWFESFASELATIDSILKRQQQNAHHLLLSWRLMTIMFVVFLFVMQTVLTSSVNSSNECQPFTE